MKSEDESLCPKEFQSLWLNLKLVKQLARKLKKVCVVLYSHTIDRVCRSAGYSGYQEALRSPRPVFVSLQDWRQRLAQEFDLPEDEVLSPEEFELWYRRLFVLRGRNAGVKSPSSQEESQAPSSPEFAEDQEKIPEGAHHEKTIVDYLSESPRRTR